MNYIRTNNIRNNHYEARRDMPFGGVVMVTARSKDFVEWVREFVDLGSWQSCDKVGDRFAIESKYAGDLLHGADCDLNIEYDEVDV